YKTSQAAQGFVAPAFCGPPRAPRDHPAMAVLPRDGYSKPLSEDANRSRHAGRSIPGPRTGFQRSPTRASRMGIVRIVMTLGSSPGLPSVHFNGAETVSLGYGRTEQGAARVLPLPF